MNISSGDNTGGKPGVKKQTPGGQPVVARETVMLFIRGDHRAFEQIFHQLYPRVIHFIHAITKDYSQAEDLAQQVFIDLWIEREKVDPEKNFSAYIYTMARNSTLTALKQQLRFETGELDPDREQESRLTDDQLIAKETGLLIDMIVAGMPPKRREVYEMSRNKDMSNDEIAKKLNISRKVVEKHIRLAINDLKNNSDLIV